MAQRVVGFEFVIREGASKRRVRLLGSGGLLGNGCLHIEDWPPAKVQQVKKRLVIRARTELERFGCVREWLGDDLPPSQRMVKIMPDAIEACELIRETAP